MEKSLPFDIELLPVKTLRAGSLTCLYEYGNLRRIGSGGVELIRMIYGAVRDGNWVTLPYHISDEVVEANEQNFRVSYHATYRLRDGEVYRAAFVLEGTPDNSITVVMRGKALADLTRNRIGLCVLHPQGVKGSDVEVTTDHGGQVVSTGFPERISPHQVLMDIRALKYTVGSTEVSMAFEGDIFETEDQRNWMDASFKTYSTPLAVPFPATLEAGDTVYNKVTIKVAGGVGQGSGRGSPETTKVAWPAMGYEKNYASPLTDEQIGQLKNIPFDHYRVELDLADAGWKARLSESIGEASRLGTKLELVIFFSRQNEEEVEDVVDALRPAADVVSHVLPLASDSGVTPLQLQERFYPVMKKAFPDVLVGYGTNVYFTELNRGRPQDERYDFVSFPLFPQAHASDTRTIIENLRTGPDIMATIRSFTDKPVFISPLTLGSRKNPPDARQQTWFAVAWTLLCLHSLDGAEKVTMFQTTGEGGMLPALDKPSNLLKTFAILKQFGARSMTARNVEEGIEMVCGNDKGETMTFRFGQEFQR